jgi:uncharacterized lipoprotein YajG
MKRPALLLLPAIALLAGCDRPPPSPERPPEPQAAAALHAPLNKARTVEQGIADAAAARARQAEKAEQTEQAQKQ